MAIAPRSGAIDTYADTYSDTYGSAGSGAAVTLAGSSTSWTVTLPTYSAGDYVVVTIGNDIATTSTMTTPTGWTLGPDAAESSGLHGKMIGRLMTGAEGSTLTLSWSAATLGVALAVAFTGVDQSTPVDAAGVAQAEASSSAVTAHVSPSLTTVTANAVLISGFVTDVAATWTSTDTELGDSGATGAGTAYATAMFYSAGVAVGSYTRTGTASAGSAKAVSMLWALRPAAGPAVYPVTVAGSVTSTGVPVRLSTRVKGGSVTFVGAKFGVFGPRLLGGTVAGSGTAPKTRLKAFTGGFTASAGLTTAVTRLRTLTGSLTSTGTVSRVGVKRPGGTSTVRGVVPRFVLHVAAGAVAARGASVNFVGRVVSGAVVGVGVMAKSMTRTRSVAGSLTGAGVTSHTAMKTPRGTVTGGGSVKRPTITHRLSGVVVAVGGLLSAFFSRIFGPAGTVTLTIGPVADTEMTVYLRHQVRTTVTVTADAVLTPRG